ncbi:MAG: hypothetical protein ACO37E_03190 [Lutimaribacter sp.]|jgi:hypothetical protein
MKPMIAGVLAAAVISVGAWYALGQLGLSSQNMFSGSNVRIE